MSRLTIPSLDATLPAAQPLLDSVKAQLGSVPNLFRLIGSSPAATRGTRRGSVRGSGVDDVAPRHLEAVGEVVGARG